MESYQEIAKVFKALCDPKRLSILAVVKNVLVCCKNRWT